MKIAIGNDHAGVEVKKNIEKLLSEKGYTVINKGYDGKESVDYPDYAKKIFKDMFKEGIKCEVDLRNQKINYKIRDHSLSKVPFLLICGSKEIKDKSVTIRKLGSEKQETKKINNAIKEFKQLNNLPIN